MTNDELLETKGHEQKLAGLIQERYAISREVAEEQIRDFFNQQKS